MKRIGLTLRYQQNNEYPETRISLDVRWPRLLMQLGMLPVLIPSDCEGVHLEKMNLDGVIFTGGNDLSCLSSDPLSAIRDSAEKRLLNYCCDQSIPVLGVCRGMQFIGVEFGEKIIAVEGHVAVNHLIRRSAGEGMPLFISIERDVNSYHQYGFEKFSSNWRVLARSGDSIVEAVEHTQKRILLIMWHPERFEPFESSDLDLIHEFFNQ